MAITIQIQKEGDRYIAWITGEPMTKVYGDTPASALGSLVGFHKSRFNILQINELPTMPE